MKESDINLPTNVRQKLLKENFIKNVRFQDILRLCLLLCL